MKEIFTLFKEVFDEWQADKASRLAAALAYYTMLSLAPLLLIVVSIAGFVFGKEAAAGTISQQISDLVGPSGADLIETAIEQADQPGAGIIATVIGIGTLLFGATGVFAQLQDAMNTIWEVQPRPDLGITGTVKKRITALTMVLGIAFLLLVSLIISALLSALNSYMSGLLPGADILWKIVDVSVSLAIITLLFAMIFKFLPDVQIAWNSVWLGAFVTAVLFTIGKTIISRYVGTGSVGTVYGAAGSLAVLLVWVYYSGLILFFGAEFTQVYARRYGTRIAPDADAVPLTPEARARQGIPRKEHVERSLREQEYLAALLTTPDSFEGAQTRGRREEAQSSGARRAVLLGFLAGLFTGIKRANRRKR